MGGGRGGIRTLEAVLPPTRFPVARTRPGYATLPKRLSAIGYRPPMTHRPYRLTDSPTSRLRSGGEGGIRTHGGSSPHRFSRAAPSTTRTPLQYHKYIVAAVSFAVGTTHSINSRVSRERTQRRVMSKTAYGADQSMLDRHCTKSRTSRRQVTERCKGCEDSEGYCSVRKTGHPEARRISAQPDGLS